MLLIDNDYIQQYRKFMLPSKQYNDVLDEDQRHKLVDFMFKETETVTTT